MADGASANGPAEAVRVIVSLGSNVEPRARYLKRALDALAALPCTQLVCASSVCETEPVDVPPRFSHLKFLNQVAVFASTLDPHEFSRQMHAIEATLGRVRTVRNGPRTVDIDLIDYGGIRSDEPDLTLPHPRAAGRMFVMEPLRELGLANVLRAAEEPRSAAWVSEEMNLPEGEF